MPSQIVIKEEKESIVNYDNACTYVLPATDSVVVASVVAGSVVGSEVGSATF